MANIRSGSLYLDLDVPGFDGTPERCVWHGPHSRDVHHFHVDGTARKHSHPQRRARIAFDAFTEASQRDGEVPPCTALSGYCSRRAIHEEEVGSPEVARVLWDSLKIIVQNGGTPVERWDFAAGAMILMRAGDSERAVEWARKEVEKFAPTGCRTDRLSNDVCATLARMLALPGEQDEAIDILEEILPAPSAFTVPLLEFDPIWDPLRDHPRFQALLVEYADDVEH